VFVFVLSLSPLSQGPEAVAEGFLSTDKSAPRSSETEQLASLIAEFVVMTERALEAHEVLMSSEMREWQDTAVARFKVLKAKSFD